jgi:hypothetical protein
MVERTPEFGVGKPMKPAQVIAVPPAKSSNACEKPRMNARLLDYRL